MLPVKWVPRKQLAYELKVLKTLFVHYNIFNKQKKIQLRSWMEEILK